MKQKPSLLFLLLASAGHLHSSQLGGLAPGSLHITDRGRLGWCLEACGTEGFCVRHSPSLTSGCLQKDCLQWFSRRYMLPASLLLPHPHGYQICPSSHSLSRCCPPSPLLRTHTSALPFSCSQDAVPRTSDLHRFSSLRTRLFTCSQPPLRRTDTVEGAEICHFLAPSLSCSCFINPLFHGISMVSQKHLKFTTSQTELVPFPPNPCPSVGILYLRQRRPLLQLTHPETPRWGGGCS